MKIYEDIITDRFYLELGIGCNEYNYYLRLSSIEYILFKNTLTKKIKKY